MTKADKKANRFTWQGALVALTVIVGLGIAVAGALGIRSAHGAEVQVHRGNEVSVWSTPQYVEGVTVVRGYSNYPVREVRESETPAATTSSVDQWFKGYDQWRRRRIQEKIRPGHTGSSFGKP